MSLTKVVSGGQTGVDRAALDAALAAEFACGGWCPEGRKAEDGPIPARYPLQVLPGASYIGRTRRNVQDSDATLIVSFGPPSGGTARTVEFCVRYQKPYLIVDANVINVDAAATLVHELLNRVGAKTLNVAGPRASGEPRGYTYAKALVGAVLRQINA
jgi:Circularly permutated YpsA SLOG family